MVDKELLKDMANVLRRDVLKMTTASGSGHPTTCLSCADIISALFFNEMSFDIDDPHNPDNDEFVLSKGHAAPILYAAFHRAGAKGAREHDLLSLRKMGSPFEGHPVPKTFPWAKVATGSLGQGLSVGVGMALAAKMQKRKFRTYVLLGDSECAEGAVYEALQLAGFNKLNNLCAILDANRLGQSRPTMVQHHINTYVKRFSSFGWNAISIDGHNIAQILDAFERAKKEKQKPTIIIAKTFKGKGVSFAQNKEGWHGKALKPEELEKALKQLPDPQLHSFKINARKKITNKDKISKSKIKTDYKKDVLIATRAAYGKGLVKVAKKDSRVIAMDAETSNSTHSEDLFNMDKSRFIEAYIAEQNMADMARGLGVKGFKVFASTFSAFWSRAHDQIRVAGLSSTNNVTYVGSHAGISIGQDGASQMGLEDIAMFRAIPDSTVLYPSDGVSTEKLVEAVLERKGMKYIRTSRPKTPIIYDNKEEFPIGDFKVVRSSEHDHAVIVGAGVTLHEAIKAQETLKKAGIDVTVVDCYSVKPFDDHKFNRLVKKCGGRIVVVEDHYPEGGIGEMISAVIAGTGFKMTHLAVRKMPHTAKPEELLREHGIDSYSITNAVEAIVKR